jgi:pimeloyl-ACP methyl ester carboxylesterase
MPELVRYPGRRSLAGKVSMAPPVARDGRQTLSREVWPVILVPGIMGSRLELASGRDRIWDPDRTGFMLWLMTQSPDFRARLYNHRLTEGRTIREIYSSSSREPEEGSAEARIPQSRTDRNWGSVSWEHYGEGAVGIQNDIAAEGGVLWCFGYDWRMSNIDNGLRLKEFIQNTVTPTCDRKPIIVTHSMGGLVTRAACAVHQAESLIGGVIHTMMPTYGAAEAYASLKYGHMDFPFRFLIGNTRLEIVCVGSGVTGMYQLMPSSRYPHRSWLSIDSRLQDHCEPRRTYSAANPYDLYREQSGLLGVADHDVFNADVVDVGANTYVYNSRRILRHILDNIDQGERYHERDVADYCHPCTWLIAGTDMETVVDARLDYHRDTAYGIELNPYSTCEMITSTEGDATVPLTSARALEFHRNCRGGFIVSGFKHSESTNAQRVVHAIGDLIRRVRDEVHA